MNTGTITSSSSNSLCSDFVIKEEKEINVSIPLSKYEELIMYKGKYEELSKIYYATIPAKWNSIRVNGMERSPFEKIPEPTVKFFSNNDLQPAPSDDEEVK